LGVEARAATSYKQLPATSKGNELQAKVTSEDKELGATRAEEQGATSEYEKEQPTATAE
jgi:hypothetical protein